MAGDKCYTNYADSIIKYDRYLKARQSKGWNKRKLLTGKSWQSWNVSWSNIYWTDNDFNIPIKMKHSLVFMQLRHRFGAVAVIIVSKFIG